MFYSRTPSLSLQRFIAHDGTGTIYVGTTDNTLIALVEDNRPSSISLSPARVDDYNPGTGIPSGGTVVGYLSTASQVIENTYTYTFTDPYGNASERFDILGDQVVLKEAERLDLEIDSACPRTYQISVISTGSGGLWVKNNLSISVTPVNEYPPTDFVLNGTTVQENRPNGWQIGTFSPLGDLDSCDTNYTYQRVSDTCGGCVQVQGNELRVANSTILDYETLQSFEVVVEMTNPPFIYPQTPRKTFTIQIT